MPLSDSYSLTLQNGYNVIQQGLVPVPGVPAHPSRNYETDQSAKLAIGDTGTSFTAGRSLSSSDDKWLGKVGAEQKLFDGVTISGSIGETVDRRHQQEFRRRLQAQLVAYFRAFCRRFLPLNQPSIAADWPRCGQIRPAR